MSKVFVVRAVSPLHTKKHFAWLCRGCAGRAKYHSESPLWFWDRAFAAQGTNGSSGPVPSRTATMAPDFANSAPLKVFRCGPQRNRACHEMAACVDKPR